MTRRQTRGDIARSLPPEHIDVDLVDVAARLGSDPDGSDSDRHPASGNLGQSVVPRLVVLGDAESVDNTDRNPGHVSGHYDFPSGVFGAD